MALNQKPSAKDLRASYMSMCIYIYMCILSQAHQQKSLVHLVPEPLEILGDIGCTALITGRSKSFFVSIPFRKQFSRGSKKHHNAYQMLYKLSPLLQKNILDFRSQNKGCYRGILYIYIIVCSFVFVPISPETTSEPFSQPWKCIEESLAVVAFTIWMFLNPII